MRKDEHREVVGNMFVGVMKKEDASVGLVVIAASVDQVCEEVFIVPQSVDALNEGW